MVLIFWHLFAVFDLTDSVGRKLFESISITLVCADCMETEHPEKVHHNISRRLHSAIF